jgi:exonuclease SbcC
MRPLSLRIQGLRSWRAEQLIDFSGVSLLAIIGDTGAGKSSILEAITYALYGGSTWDPKEVKSLISDGESTMRVELTFQAEGKRWTVTRTASRGSYPPAIHRLVCEDGPRFDKAADVSREVERLVGLDYKAFLRAVVLPQGRFALLLQATETDRSAILKGIFRLEDLERARTHAEESLRRLRELSDGLGARRMKLLPDPEAAARDAEARLAEAEREGARLDGVRARIQAEREIVRRAREEATRLEELGEGITRAHVPDVTTQLETLARTLRAGEERAYELEKDEAASRAEETTRLAALAEMEARLGGATAVAKARALVHQAEDELPRITRGTQELDTEETALGEAERAEGTRAEELVEQSAQVKAREEELATRRAESTRRSAALEETRASLRRLRDAQQAEKKGETRLAEAKAAREEGAERARVAEGTRDTSRATLTRAREQLGRAEQQDLAARAAHGAHAGEPCPVCARPLPDGFSAPARGPIEALEQAKIAAESAAHEALAAFEQARAAATSRAQDVARAESELAEIRVRTTAEKAALLGALGDVDLRKKDATLLAEKEAALTTLQATLVSEERALTELRRRETELRVALAHEAKRFAERRRAISARRAEINERRTRIADQLAALPRELASPLEAAALAEARARLEAHERARETLDEALRGARRRLEESLAARRALDSAMSDARAALNQLTQKLTALALRVTDAQRFVGAQTIAEAPAGPSALDAARFAGTVTRAANELGERIGRQITRCAAAEADAGQRVSAALAEVGAESEVGLEQGLVGARAEASRARSDGERALRERPLAQRLDAHASQLGARIAALEEVRGKLSDAKFVKFVVAERQKALLATASELLGAMTGGRFGFAASFEVVDRLSGQPRSPKTLSGGETFVASLALALGLVELAGRSGGRLEALFLDEGFGSLDAHSLGEALAVLGEQASGGRLVAVISHLRSVAETIDDVLSVRRGAKGSEAVWLRGEGREALAVKDVEDALLG